MSATADRDQISALAKIDFERALSDARRIEDHWFAAQALAWVARFAPEPAIGSITADFQRRADSCADDYQRAAVRAWVIRALAERGHREEAERELSTAIALARRAIPLPSRSEALFLLFQAAYLLGAHVVAPVVEFLLETWFSERHWRCQRALVNSLAMLSAIDPASAETVKRRCSDAGVCAKVERAVQHGPMEPRPFFW